MSDDLVRQSLAELHDIVRCRCHPAYTGRGMHDPACECDSVEAVKVVADRIEELEAVLREVDAWVEDLGYYADEGAVLVSVFKKVKAVLGKGYT